MTKGFVVTMMFFLLFVGTVDYSNAVNSDIPKIKTVIATQNSVKIEWSKVKKAKKYYVCRKDGKGQFKHVGTVSSKSTLFRDNNTKVGNTYQYIIIAKKERNKRPFRSKVKKVTPKYVKPCILVSLSNRFDKSKKFSTITWKGSKSTYYYKVFRKTKDSKYVLIATVKGVNGKQSYTDKTISDKTDYTYTVRAVEKHSDKSGAISYWSNYDSEGITTIAQKVDMDGDIGNFENLHTTIKWKPVSKATHYYIYREKGYSGKFKLLGKVKKDTTRFIDVYSKTLTTEAEKKDLFSYHFVDPDRNPFHYTVRAIAEKNGKISYGDYYIHGVFSLSQPQIMAATHINGNEYSITFCEVPNAMKYEIWSASKNGTKLIWHKLTTVNDTTANAQTATVKKNTTDTYFTVKAIATMKEKRLESTFDRGFSIADREKLANIKVLFYGDSITYGSGYSGMYAYPIRVQQLTGCDYYNPSIPGATYTQETTERKKMHPLTERDRLYDQVGIRMRDGDDIIKSYNDTVTIPVQPDWGRTFDKYDVVIFAAGTNDYLDNAEIGDLNSDDPHEYCGAINMTMKYIQDGSNKRVSKGEAPIKVIFLDQFYSDRTYFKNWGKKTNRDTTVNDIGFTLSDYQNAQDALIEKYRSGYIFESNYNDDDGNGNDSDSDYDMQDVTQPTGQTPENVVFNDEESSNETDLSEEEVITNKDEKNVTDNNEIEETKDVDVLRTQDENGTMVPQDDSQPQQEFNYGEGATKSEEDRNQSEQSIACEMDIYDMSTRNIINEKTCPYFMLDNLHLSRTGSNLVGNYVSEFLMTKVY